MPKGEMNMQKKLLVVLTAVGLLGTGAAVGASGMVSKVTGIWHKDIAVSVNGQSTSLTPVYINGKAYLPARDAAAELGYTLNWNAKGKEIQINAKETQEAELARMLGVVVDVKPTDKAGQYRVELLGYGDQRWMLLTVDKDTELSDESGKAVAAADLKAGSRLMAEFGPMITKSFPGQSHAHKIVFSGDTLVKEDVIQSIEKTEDGWQIKFGETKDGKSVTTLVLNAGKETSVMTAQGESVPFADLKAGDQVRAYYGPHLQESLPPKGPLHFLVVLSDKAQLAPETIEEYRELAWKHVPAGEKSHLITKREEAAVEEVDSANIGLMASTEAQKKKLQEIQAANGKLVQVTYSTDQDALIGPLSMLFTTDTKELLGFMPRK
jgi:hypothetical protein